MVQTDVSSSSWSSAGGEPHVALKHFISEGFVCVLLSLETCRCEANLFRWGKARLECDDLLYAADPWRGAGNLQE